MDINSKRQVSAVQKSGKPDEPVDAVALPLPNVLPLYYRRAPGGFLHPDNTLAGSALSTRKHETFPKFPPFCRRRRMVFLRSRKNGDLVAPGSA